MKHKVVWGSVIGLTVLYAMGTMAGNDFPESTTKVTPEESRQPAAPAPAPDPDLGKFEVIVKSTGSASGSVTYVVPTSDSFNMSQESNAAFPWRKAWEGVGSLPLGWNMNAQQNGGGTLTCIVKHDGEVIAKNTSSGQYVMVTCSP